MEKKYNIVGFGGVDISLFFVERLMEHHKLGVIATHKVASQASCILGQAENFCRGCCGQFSEK